MNDSGGGLHESAPTPLSAEPRHEEAVVGAAG